MRRPIFLAVLLLFLVVAAGQAQKLESQPGYVPIQALGLFPEDQLEVEINLNGPLLNLVAAATNGEDPQFSAVMKSLKSIQVQVFPLKGVDPAGIKTRIGHAVHWLEERGWKSTLRVRDKGQETYIYLKESGGKVEGLTLLSLDPGDEAVVINIVGRIDPDQIGRISQSLHVNVPQLQKDSPKGGSPKKPH
jgi:hypothetical protein